MAHTLGEEAFVDGDADGYYTAGETFTDNTEAFRDDNESSAFEAGELFIDLDSDGTFAEATPVTIAPGGLFNGLACNADSTVCSEDLISVFANLELIAGPQDASSLIVAVTDSSSTPVVEGVNPMDPGSYVVSISDNDGNAPPFGTVVSAVGSGECEVVSPSFTVPSTSENSAINVGISVVATGANEPDTEDRVTVSVSIPSAAGGSGNETTLVFSCNP